MASFCSGVRAWVLVGGPLVCDVVGDALVVGELVDDVEVAGVVGAGVGVAVHAAHTPASTTTPGATANKERPDQRIPKPPLPATERVLATITTPPRTGHPSTSPCGQPAPRTRRGARGRAARDAPPGTAAALAGRPIRHTLKRMCRSIKPLNNLAPPVTTEEIQAAALQYVRKVAGTRAPSQANAAAFDEAVHIIAHATEHLLAALTTSAPPRTREELAAAARARFAARTRA